MLPCPKCGRAVVGKAYGGNAAFGCGEYDFEIECECGVMFNVGPFDTEAEALEGGERLWDERPNANEHDELVRLLYDLDDCRRLDDCEKCLHHDDRSSSLCDLNLAQRISDAMRLLRE